MCVILKSTPFSTHLIISPTKEGIKQLDESFNKINWNGLKIAIRDKEEMWKHMLIIPTIKHMIFKEFIKNKGHIWSSFR